MSLRAAMRVRSNGEMAGFQPADAGSTPATRTEEKMTLDEAIGHADEKAATCEGACAADHAQLAAWLRELKMLREIVHDEDFTSCRSDHASVAQVVERLPEEQGVVGSTPTRSTTIAGPVGDRLAGDGRAA